jgi:hypothetical protein
MEECKIISPSCEEFSCKEVASKNELEDGFDHGNGDFEDQSGNGEDENGAAVTTSTVEHPVSTQVTWWDFLSDSDYLSWDHDENGESGGHDKYHNNEDGRDQGNSSNGNKNTGDPSGNGAGEGGEGDCDDEASYSGHESMSEDGSMFQ